MVGTTNRITHSPMNPQIPMAIRRESGMGVNPTLKVQAAITIVTATTLADRRIPRCSCQSRSSFPKIGDRKSQARSRGEDREKQ